MEQTNGFSFLAEHLKKYPVVFAYLFGSAAKGNTTGLSDIDIAVYIDEKLTSSEGFDLRLRLTNELSSFLGKKTDILIMNNVPLSLGYEVIKNGKIIFCTDRDKRVELETCILSKYLDRRHYDKRRAETALRKFRAQGLSA